MTSSLIRRTLVVVTTVAFAFAGTTTALAASTTEYPTEGGTWKYGTRFYAGTQWEAWSEYDHSRSVHAAAAWWFGNTQTWSAKTSPGKTAKASQLGSTAGKAGYAVYR